MKLATKLICILLLMSSIAFSQDSDDETGINTIKADQSYESSFDDEIEMPESSEASEGSEDSIDLDDEG